MRLELRLVVSVQLVEEKVFYCFDVVAVSLAVDNLHNRRSEFCTESRVLRGESVSNAGLWYVGERQQVQQRVE